MMVLLSQVLSIRIKSEVQIPCTDRPLVSLTMYQFHSALILSLIHIVDQPYNAWPSLHVGHSLCVVLCVPLIYNVNRFAYALLWVAWLFLTLSTMTTQQHYLFDVVTGILFALIAHYRFIKPVIDQCNANEFDEAFEDLQANKPEPISG